MCELRTYLAAEGAHAGLPHHAEDVRVVGVLAADVDDACLLVSTHKPRLSECSARLYPRRTHILLDEDIPTSMFGTIHANTVILAVRY